MIVAAFSWMVALFSAWLPRKQSDVALIPLVFVTLLSVGTALATVYAPLEAYVAAKDRPLYEIYYDRLDWSAFSFDFEPAYSALQLAAGSLGLSSGAFFAVVAVFFLGSLNLMLTRRYPLATSMLLLFLTLNFFPFMQGALNVTRQFIAAGTLLFAFPHFERVIKSEYRDFRALTLVVLIILIAAAFHRSALMCLVPLALLSLNRSPTFIFSIVAFFLVFNFTGLGRELWGPLLSFDQNASENMWSFERGEVGLLYTGGVNRVDFAAFSLAPIIVHFGAKQAGVFGKQVSDSMTLFYFCLVFPLFLFSFAPYSDRLALFGWQVWLVAMCDQAVRSNSPWAQPFVFMLTAVIGAIAYFSLYELTTTQLVQGAFP